MDPQSKQYLRILIEVADYNNIPRITISKKTLEMIWDDLKESEEMSQELVKVTRSHQTLVEANNQLLADLTKARKHDNNLIAKKNGEISEARSENAVLNERNHQLIHDVIPNLHKRIVDLELRRD